jgi:hypothetical protein
VERPERCAAAGIAVILAHVLPIVLTALVLASLWVHTVYRMPGGLLIAILPWLGTALVVLTPLMAINRLIGRMSPTTLPRVARVTLELSVAVGVLGVLTPAHPLTQWVMPCLVSLALAAGGVLLAVLVSDLLDTVRSPELMRALRWIERGALAVVGVFVLLGGVALVNGAADSGPLQEVRAEIQDTGGLILDVGRVTRMGWGDVRRTTPGARTERMLLSSVERRTFFPGQAIVLRMRPGALGLPWVVQVIRDEEALAYHTLLISPNSRISRNTVLRAALKRREWERARVLALDYFDRFRSPEDATNVFDAANDLGIAQQNAAALSILEPLAARHPTGEILGLAGYVHHEARQYERARELLEAAVVKDPGWLNYYRLGIVYQSLRRYDDSIRALERASAVWDLPEIRTRIKTVKLAQVAQATK